MEKITELRLLRLTAFSDGVSDFFDGFVKGFTGVFQAAAPVLTTVASFL
jgi:hypothetical protein